MKKRYVLLYIFLLIFIFLAAFEAGLRLFKVVPTKVVNESIYPGVLGDYKPNQELNSDFMFSYHVRINSLGLRGREFSREKPAGTYRIMVLGDSYTFGERVSEEETFPFLLEKLFWDSGRRDIQVINAGHSAYSTRDEYEYLLERGIYLGPDMVILAWFPNDISELRREYSWRDLLKKHYRYEPYKSMARSFAIFNYLRIAVSYRMIKANLEKEAYYPEDKLWQRCFDNLSKINELCAQRNIKFILTALVGLDEIHCTQARFRQEQKIHNFAKERGITYIDLTGIFSESFADKFFLMPNDPHFSPQGNAAVAQEIFDFLKGGIK